MAETEAERRKKRRHRVEGHGAKMRLDRKASGGKVDRTTFNAAIHDQPARPTVDESDAVPAVHNRARGGVLPPKGWVDGQPERESEGRKDGGKWIQGAIKHPGALHRELGVPEGHKIPEKKLEKAAHSRNPTIERRAHLAETLKGFHHK